MKSVAPILACLFVDLLLCHSQCSEPPPKEPFAKRLSLAGDGPGLYSWLRHGSLFYLLPPNDGNMLYCEADGPLIEISDFSSFSWMLREELQDQASVTAFVKGSLPRVFVLFFGPAGELIDEKFIHYLSRIPPEGWKLNDTPPAAVTRSLQILEKYKYSGPTIENQRWQVDFYLIFGSGSVEKYQLRGDMQPFAVVHFEHATAEKPGTIAVPLSPGTRKAN